MKIYFECDGMGCKESQKEGKCPNDECRMTSDVWHAKNFLVLEDAHNKVYAFEMKSSVLDKNMTEDIFNAIEDTTWYHIGENGALVSGANEVYDEPLYKARDIFKAIESVIKKYDEEACDDR